VTADDAGQQPPGPRTLVVLPTYNERENLRQLVDLLLQIEPELGIVVVDDASPDGTGTLADDLSRERASRLQVIHRAGKLGLGSAYLEGFRLGLAMGADTIVTMDADFSHDPAHLDRMLEVSRHGADLVIGSRYIAGGSTPDFPLHRRVLSATANVVAHALVGLRARDATAGFRCYKRRVLLALPLDVIRSNGYSFLIEILFLVQRFGFDVVEVPIVFRDRTRGASKISKDEIWKAVVTVLRLTWLRFAGGGRRADRQRNLPNQRAPSDDRGR